MRGQQKKRQELQAKLDGSPTKPFMSLNSWRGWKVTLQWTLRWCFRLLCKGSSAAPQERRPRSLFFSQRSCCPLPRPQVVNDLWKEEEAKGSVGAKIRGAAEEGSKVVRPRKHKNAMQLQPIAVSSRTLFKAFMASRPPSPPSAPQAPVRKAQLEPLDKKLQGTTKQRHRAGPLPAKASAAAEPTMRDAAGANEHQSITEDPGNPRSSLAAPREPLSHESPSHEPRRARAAPPGRLQLPREDYSAPGGAMPPSLVTPSLWPPSLLVSPLSSGSKQPQQPARGGPRQGQSPIPSGHQGQDSVQHSRFRPPADAPQPSRCSSHPPSPLDPALSSSCCCCCCSRGSRDCCPPSLNSPRRPQQSYTARIAQGLRPPENGAQGLRPPENGASNSPSAARAHQRQQQGGGGGSPALPHQDEESTEEPKGPRPPESGAPNSPAAPPASQQQHQQQLQLQHQYQQLQQLRQQQRLRQQQQKQQPQQQKQQQKQKQQQEEGGRAEGGRHADIPNASSWGGGSPAQPHQDEESKAEPKGPRPPEIGAPNSPAAPPAPRAAQQQQQQQEGGRMPHADIPTQASRCSSPPPPPPLPADPSPAPGPLSS